MRKYLRLALCTFALLAASGPALAESLPQETQIRFGGERQYRGQFTLRYWYVNNSIDQSFKSPENPETGQPDIDTFANTKLSFGMLNLNTDYWFGIMTPEGLGFLGTVFGLGIDLGYADQLVQNVRLMTYTMDFEFAKISLFHDEDWKNSLTLTGNYVSYFNTVYDNLLLTTAAPYFGVGLGLEGRHPIASLGEMNYKIVYLPSTRTPNPLPDGMGLKSEINSKWFINPNLAFNVGYRFNFFTAAGVTQAQSTTTGEAISLNRNLQDMFHGLNIGFTNYF